MMLVAQAQRVLLCFCILLIFLVMLAQTHPLNLADRKLNEDVLMPESNEDSDGNDIVFPDSSEIETEPIAKLEKPPGCAGEDGTFCEQIETYPYDHLREVLRQKKNTDLFGVDESPDEIAERIGDGEDTFVCASVSKTIFPKVGKNSKNAWKYIINQGDGFSQGVRVEICSGLDKPCKMMDNLPSQYHARCKQKYIYRRMLAVSEENGYPEPDTFFMPSACCCAYKKNRQFLAGFGLPITLKPS